MPHVIVQDWKLSDAITRMVGFYHKDCTDGYFSGALLKRVFEHIGKPFELYPVTYKDELLSFVLPGDQVVFADMSASPDVILAMAEKAVGVAVYDHHDTAIRKFDQLPQNYFQDDNVILMFDEKRCGTQLVFDELAFPILRIGDLRHYERLLDRVQTWDLQLPDAQKAEYRSFAAYCKAKLTSLRAVDDFLNLYMVDGFAADQRVMEQARLLMETEDNHVQWAIENTLRVVSLEVPNGDGRTTTYYDVALVNAPKYLCTQIGRALEDNFSIVMIYHETAMGRVYRISSKKGGIIVNTIAEQFNGGGHPHAAGIQVLRDSYLGRL